MENEIRIVIGSWGSYNECNERALGSRWLCLNDYEDWDEIVEELKKEGILLESLLEGYKRSNGHNKKKLRIKAA